MSQRHLFIDESPPPGAPVYDRNGRLVPLKLFLGLKPPEAVAQQIEGRGRDWRRGLRLQGYAMPAPRLHITLQVLGVYPGVLPAGVLEAVQAAMTRLDYPAFEVDLDHAQSFAGSHAFVLHGGEHEAAIRELGVRLGMALRSHGLHPQHSRKPHMTLVYDGSHDVPDREVEAIHWTASEVLLVLSPQGLGRHDHLGSWPLRH